ncbi:MAG: Protein of unknown function precursor [Bacteroidetes bacterium]|nr:Protein of unknown function precursor [Bacteroidota bacterium]
MKASKPLFLFIFLSLIITTKSFCQDYLDERTLKLSEISDDNTYGYKVNNPVKVGRNKNVDGAYLNALKSTTGAQMHVANMKFDVKGKTGLEMVVLSFEGSQETKTLYISTTELDHPKAPAGFAFKSLADIPKVILFPDDSIVKVTTCSTNIYCVSDLMLKEAVGNLPAPDKNPDLAGGKDELTKFFAANPLTNEKTKQIVFRVSISFLVTCEGKAGNFKIITKGHGDLATYANEVLAITNKMPKTWQPAIKDGKTVDCYQVVSFTVVEGKLDKCSIR